MTVTEFDKVLCGVFGARVGVDDTGHVSAVGSDRFGKSINDQLGAQVVRH